LGCAPRYDVARAQSRFSWSRRLKVSFRLDVRLFRQLQSTIVPYSRLCTFCRFSFFVLWREGRFCFFRSTFFGCNHIRIGSHFMLGLRGSVRTFCQTVASCLKLNHIYYADVSAMKPLSNLNFDRGPACVTSLLDIASSHHGIISTLGTCEHQQQRCRASHNLLSPPLADQS